MSEALNGGRYLNNRYAQCYDDRNMTGALSGDRNFNDNDPADDNKRWRMTDRNHDIKGFHRFDRVVHTRYLRIVPRSWYPLILHNCRHTGVGRFLPR